MKNNFKTNSVIFALLIISIFLINSCTSQNQQVVCNKPYILVGNSCCLDKNDNGICDNDETQKKETINNVPQINESKKIEEKKEVIQTKEEQKYSIDELQADVSKAIQKDILLEKVKESDKFDLYLTRSKTATLIADYFGLTVFKVLEKYDVAVIDLKDESLNSKENFLNYVKDKIPVLTSYLNNRENELIDDAKNGHIYDIFKKDGSFPEFINYSTSDEILYDSITPLSTVSDKIVEISKVNTQHYNLTYKGIIPNRDKFTEKNVLGLKYVQAYGIFCGKRLVIILYGKDYGDKIKKSDIDNYIRNLRSEYIITSEKVVRTCGDKYSLS